MNIKAISKKLLSVVLATALLLSCLLIPGLVVSAETSELDVWDGKYTTAPVDTNNDGYYDIYTPEEFAYVIYNGGVMNDSTGHNFVIHNDIYLNHPNAVNWTSDGAVNDGYTANKWFYSGLTEGYTRMGSINIWGNGHTVYGLYGQGYENDNENGENGVGLIPAIDKGVTIKIDGLNIDYARFVVTNMIGYFIGACNWDGNANIQFTNCSTGVNTRMWTGKHMGTFVGLAYDSNNISLTNCYSINSDAGVATYLIDNNNNKTPTFTNCYYYSTKNGGGLVKTAAGVNATNTYTNVGSQGTVITYEEMIGATTIMSLGDAFYTTDTFPKLKKFTTAPSEYDVWDGTVKAPADSNSDGVYEITNAEELAYVVKNGGGSSYILTNDIYINDPAAINYDADTDAYTKGTATEYKVNQWFTSDPNGIAGHVATPLASGTTIDGNGHMVFGLLAVGLDKTGGEDGVALFPQVASGATVTVKNLGIDHAYIKSVSQQGLLFGVVSGDNTVANVSKVYFGENVKLAGGDAGGAGSGIIVGYGWGSGTKVDISNVFALNGNGKSLVTSQFSGTTVVQYSYILNGSAIAKANKNSYHVYQTIQGGTFTADDGLITDLEAIQGRGALNNMNLKDWDGNCAFVETETYPALAIFADRFNPVPPVVIPTPDYTVWNGTSDTAPSLVDGVYIIDSAEKLAYVIKTGGGAGNTYKLTTDIYLNNLGAFSWSDGTCLEGYTPKKWLNASETQKFQGTLDGDGHVVYGIYGTFDGNYANGGMDTATALVSSASGATIKNIGVEYSFIRDLQVAGGLIGIIDGANTVLNSYVGDDVFVGAANAGGIAGVGGGNVTMTNVYSLATVYGKASSSGLVSTGSWGKYYATNCYVAGAELGNLTTNTNSYVATSGDKGSAELAGKLGFAYAYVEGEYPVLKVFNSEAASVDYPFWNGTTSAPSDSNTDGIIEINNAEELAYVVKNGGGASYKLTTDIYLNNLNLVDWSTGNYVSVNQWFTTDAGAAAERKAVALADGTVFDGDGHMIYGLYANGIDVAGSEDGVGLFPQVASGAKVTVKNFGMDYAYVTSSSQHGLLFGLVKGEDALATVNTVFFGENVTIGNTGAGNGAGVIVGYGYSARVDVGDVYALNANGKALIGNEFGGTAVVQRAYVINGSGISRPSKNLYHVYETAPGGTPGTLITDLNTIKGPDALENMDLTGYDGSLAFVATEGYPVLSKFVPFEPIEGEWNGTTVAPSDANGDGVYEINTAEELAYVILNGGGHKYVITKDIYLNDPARFNAADGTKHQPVNEWYHSEVTEGYVPMKDGTVIDGNGHVVYGLYRNGGDSTGGDDGSALIPAVANAEGTVIVKNLGIDHAYVNTNSQTGLFVGTIGHTMKVNFENCYAGKNVSFAGQYKSVFFGYGTAPITLTNCYALNANGYGLTGERWGASTHVMNNCYVVNGVLASKGTPSGTNNHVATEANKGDAAFASTLGFAYNYVEGDYPALKVFDAELGNVDYTFWNGTTSAPSDSNTDGVIEINTAEELAYVVKNGGGASFVLTSDIYLNNLDLVDWANGGYISVKQWFSTDASAPDANKAVSLKDGTIIDGAGHMVYGLYANGLDTTGGADGVALFPQVESGATVTVKNLGIDNAYVDSSSQHGILFGSAAGANLNVESTFVGANVTIGDTVNELAAGNGAGVFVGYAYGGTIKFTNCYALNANGKGFDGAPCQSATTFTNCYALGGSLTLRSDNKTIVNSYEEVEGAVPGTPITDLEAIKGENALTVMPLGFAFTTSDSYPVLKAFVMDGSSSDRAWDGEMTAPNDANNDGVYEITNARELAYVIWNGGGQSYELTGDIYVNDIELFNWVDGSTIAGYTAQSWFHNKDEGYTALKDGTVIDGNGYVVYGLYYDFGGGSYSGVQGSAFIPEVAADADILVKDLGIAWSNIHAQQAAGFVCVGSTYSDQSKIMTFENCYLDDTVKIYGQGSGAFFGVAAGRIATTNCYSLANLGGTYVGWTGQGYGVNCFANNCFIVGASMANSGAALMCTNNCYETVASPEGKYYSEAGKGALTEVTAEMMKGCDVFTNSAKMPNLNAGNGFYAVRNTAVVEYPSLRFMGAYAGDVDEDGVNLTANDVVSARKALVGLDGWANLDFNRDGVANICDLVALTVNVTDAAPAVIEGVEFNLPATGGVITYTAGDEDAATAAEVLKAYFAAHSELTVVASNAAPVNVVVEVVIDDSMAANAYTVAVVGEKLVFTAQNGQAALEAVNEYLERNPIYGSAAEFSGTYADAMYTVTRTNAKSETNTYTYVWGDEFVGNSLDSTKWTATVADQRMGSFADMATGEGKDVINVANGSLTLSAIKTGDNAYKAPATVQTFRKMQYRYGYLEMKARVPFDEAVWPSLWMSATSGRSEWNYASDLIEEDGYSIEVDIFEVMGSTDTLSPNIHKWYADGSRDSAGAEKFGSGGRNNYTFASGSPKDEFHTYGFEWTPTRMSMYVDGTCYQTFDITSATKVFGLYSSWTNEDMRGFHHPMIIMLNNHLFTNASTEAGYNFSKNGDTIQNFEDSLPAEYEIDWIRLYQNDASGTYGNSVCYVGENNVEK